MESFETGLIVFFLFLILATSDVVISTYSIIISRKIIQKDGKKGDSELFAAGLIGYSIVLLFSFYLGWSFFRKEHKVHIWRILIAMATVSLAIPILIILGWKKVKESLDYQHNSKYKTLYVWMLILGIGIPVLTMVLTIIFSRIGKEKRIKMKSPEVPALQSASMMQQTFAKGLSKQINVKSLGLLDENTQAILAQKSSDLLNQRLASFAR